MVKRKGGYLLIYYFKKVQSNPRPAFVVRKRISRLTKVISRKYGVLEDKENVKLVILTQKRNRDSKEENLSE